MQFGKMTLETISHKNSLEKSLITIIQENVKPEEIDDDGASCTFTSLDESFKCPVSGELFAGRTNIHTQRKCTIQCKWEGLYTHKKVQEYIPGKDYDSYGSSILYA